jgi:hypothetical protein
MEDRPEEGYSWPVKIGCAEVLEKSGRDVKLFPHVLREECKKLLLMKPMKGIGKG